MGILIERALTALERIADALTSLAKTANTPLGDLAAAQHAANSPAVASENGPEAQGSPEAPSACRTRVSKARREAVRDAVMNAGLDLAAIEKDFNAVWASWSGAQCDKAEAMANEAIENAALAPRQESEDDDFDSPAPAATPPAPAGTAFAQNPPSHYDKDREALTSAIAKAKAALGAENGDVIVRGLMASIGGAPDMLSMDPAKYAAVCSAIMAVIPAAPASPAPQAEAKPVTLEEVRALAQHLTAKLGDKQPVRDIIQRVAGTAKLTDVPKDKLGELFTAFKEAA